MQAENEKNNEERAFLPVHPNIDELWRFMQTEGDERTIRAFILLLENALSTP